MKNNIDPKWTTIIKPKTSLFTLNLKDIWKYRDLIKMFVRRDFYVIYKQTVLGPVWFIIQPLFTAGMFSFIFGSVAKISTDGIPPLLFYMAGVINWAYFSDCLSNTSNTFAGNAGLFGKVYFPRLTVPISIVILNTIKYSIKYLVFIVTFFIFIYQGHEFKYNWIIILTPILILYMSLIGLGFGIWISSVTTKYRDIRMVLPFFVQLWMYATPVIYPISIIPEKYKVFILLNPMAPVIEIFRVAYLGAGTISINHLLISIGITFSVLLSGIIIFNRIERTFMDTV